MASRGARSSLSPMSEDGLPALTEAEAIAMPGGSVEVMLPPDTASSEDIDLDPGIPAPAAIDPTLDHGANIAEALDETVLSMLASDVIEAAEEDDQSRSEWKAQVAEGMKLMGLTWEKRTYPFNGASGVYDGLMAEAVLRFQAIARGELLPAAGPVKTQIVGASSQELEDQASRVKMFMNLYLTDLAPEWYEEFDQMLLWLPLIGSAFKKVYQDSVLLRPVAPFIDPQNFIVPYTASDLETAVRMTEVLNMNRRRLRERQLNGLYRDISLPPPEQNGISSDNPITTAVQQTEGVTPVTMAKGTDNDYQLLEQHRDMVIDGWSEPGAPADLPLPYIITVEKNSRKVLGVRRNWKQGDTRYQRRPYYVHYKMFPGFGFYGMGYAHILGSAAASATATRRQLHDTATLNAFPGGLRVKGMRIEDNNLGIGPTEFREIDTGGQPIQQAVMSMPYKEPSPVMLELLRDTKGQAEKLVGNAEIAVGDGRQDAPVGTTVALLEQATKLQSASIKRGYQAQRREFKMIAAIFGETLPEKPYPFPVPGAQAAIMRSDFSDRIDILPVGDPNVTNQAQRMLRAETVVRGAQTSPQIHDPRAAYQLMYEQMGFDAQQIARILPTPQQAQPLDPLSENQNAMLGMPVRAAPWQDHQSHIMVHQMLGEMPAMQAHIAEHMALQMRVMIESQLGMQLPVGQQLPPEVENRVAMLTAKAVEAIKQQQPGANDPTPMQLAMEELRIQAQKIAQDYQTAQGKATLESYRANLEFQAKNLDRASKETIARINAAAKIESDRLSISAAEKAAAKRTVN